MNARGIYGQPRVGLSLYHSVGDRADAVKQLDLDWNRLYQILASQAGVLIVDPSSSSGFRYMSQIEFNAHPPDPKMVTWWKSVADPLIQQWVKFKHEQLGGDLTLAPAYQAFAERFMTSWDVYEGWKKKYDTLRAEALQRGFKVDAPAASKLPTTAWADTASFLKRKEHQIEEGVGDVWTFVKYGAWAALGLGAIVALSSVAQSMQRGRDPAAGYVRVRAGRRALALPAGAS